MQDIAGLVKRLDMQGQQFSQPDLTRKISLTIGYYR
jgi:hypothetical protein